MSKLDTYLRQFNHFEIIPNGRPQLWSTAKDRFHLWSVDECEDCGGECEAPNTANVTISGDPIQAFEQAGLTERALSDCLGELGYSDEFGGAVCPACYSKAEKEAEAQ